jgi:nitrite reductase/ring-hydroxylating ferredoxin subunit
MLTEFLRAARVGDLKDGTMMPVTVGGEDVLLALVEGEYFAIGNQCTHFEAYLSDGYLDIETREVRCPMHESCFSLVSGEPNEPPADEAVATFAVKVAGADILVGPK